jgi:hypothetical protein
VSGAVDDGAAPPAPFWAKVEIFGHRRHFGRVSEVEQFGTKMLRVDVPIGDGEKFATFTYGGASIFGLTPLTEEACRKWAAYDRPSTVDPLALMPPEPYRARVFDDDEDREAADADAELAP